MQDVAVFGTGDFGYAAKARNAGLSVDYKATPDVILFAKFAYNTNDQYRLVGGVTGTGTILAGDVVTFAGDSNKYVVATAFSGGSFTINAPGLRAALADNTAITVGNTAAQNVAFDRNSILLATRLGEIKKTLLREFEEVRRNGKIAMKFEGEDEDDRLIGVALLDESDDVLLATRQGKAIRFQAEDVREFQSRNSTGVRGMRLGDGDQVMSLSILHRSGAEEAGPSARTTAMAAGPRADPWDGPRSSNPTRRN